MPFGGRFGHSLSTVFRVALVIGLALSTLWYSPVLHAFYIAQPSWSTGFEDTSDRGYIIYNFQLFKFLFHLFLNFIYSGTAVSASDAFQSLLRIAAIAGISIL